MSFRYEYPRPAVTVDVVLFRVLERKRLQVLLIQRQNPPFRGRWALPGGFVDQDEDLEPAARRELLEETGVEVERLVQLGAYGRPGRDPRGHTVSVVFLAWDALGELWAEAGDDAADARWFSPRRPPAMAFDHRQILRDAGARLTAMSDDPRRLAPLLPRRFLLGQLRALVQAASGRNVTEAALARQWQREELLVRTATLPEKVRGRQVHVYRLRGCR